MTLFFTFTFWLCLESSCQVGNKVLSFSVDATHTPYQSLVKSPSDEMLLLSQINPCSCTWSPQILTLLL